ncbi:NAD(P)-binding domain-containing protein [Nocardia sp. R6R-6]|uniref:NAD(P)-binding domain-containing protein n=1 Tax=Nocardia sp. R6R-6 TaxID=3459303 RepID=UPI00403E1B7D
MSADERYAATTVDVVIVGAGFAGLNALYRMRHRGFTAVLLEAGDSVGGTWYWNKYPGARVDIESLEYSYGFRDDIQQDWHWSEKYAGQPEVERYLNWVADRLDLRPDIRFGRRVTRMIFAEASATWTTTATVDGAEEVFRSSHVVLATGFLSTPNYPDIPGLDRFRGELVHTGAWPDPDPVVADRRVGVVGTAASGVQVIQSICPDVAHLAVFQRTANWCFPLRNAPMDPDYEQFVKENYAEIRQLEHESRGPGMVLMDGRIVLPEARNAVDVGPAERLSDFEWRWRAGGVHMGRSFPDLIRSESANDELRSFLERKIRAVVRDRETADKLVPNHPPLSRRPPGESGYYEAFNRDNVELIDIGTDPVAEILPEGVRQASGAVHELDVLIFATGFDAATGAALRIDIRGRAGRRLAEHWSDGARTLLGLMTAGFPNLYFVNGPQSPAFHFSPPLLCDFQTTYIADLIDSLASTGRSAIEPAAEAERTWGDHANSVYEATLIWKTDSWWVGANIPGKPRQALAYGGGFAQYRSRARTAMDSLCEFVTA